MRTALEYYNKTASSWSDEWLAEKKESGIAKTFFELFSQAGNYNPRILDAGCGTGYDFHILKDMGANVVGVDFSENLIQVAKENNPGDNLFVYNIEDTLEDLGQFDGIYCVNVLNYIDITKLKLVFNNFSKILKKGGLLFVSALNGNGKNENKSFSFVDGEEYDLNFSNINSEQICTFARENFKLVDTFCFDDFAQGYKYYVFQKQ